MLLLTSTSDLISVVTTSTSALHVQASFVDYNSGTVTPGRTNTIISSATTTTVVGSPGSSTQRNVKRLSLRNTDVAASQTVTVRHTDGTTVVELVKITLATQEFMQFDDEGGWTVFDSNGNVKRIDTSAVTVALPTQTSQPFAPGVGNTVLWAQKWAGRPLLAWDGEGINDSTRIQPGLFGNGIKLYKPGSSTTVGSYLGGLLTSGGTVSHPAQATTNFRTMMYATNWANIVTTTNQILGIRSNDLSCWRGNAGGLGGFFFFCRFSFPLFPTGTRVFVGLSSLTSGVQVSADPSGAAHDGIGLAMDIADTNLTLMTKDSTTNTKTAIGGGLARTANDVYDLMLYCKPNDSIINYRLDKYASSGGAVTTLVDSSISTTIPRNTVFLSPMALMSNGTANTTVTTVQLAVSSMYLESDF